MVRKHGLHMLWGKLRCPWNKAVKLSGRGEAARQALHDISIASSHDQQLMLPGHIALPWEKKAGEQARQVFAFLHAKGTLCAQYWMTFHVSVVPDPEKCEKAGGTAGFVRCVLEEYVPRVCQADIGLRIPHQNCGAL
jgi:hypothetical protein